MPNPLSLMAAGAMSGPSDQEKRLEESEPDDTEDLESTKKGTMLTPKYTPCIAVLFTLATLLLVILTVVLLIPFKDLITGLLNNNANAGCCACPSTNAASSSQWEHTDIVRIYDENPALMKTERESPDQPSWEDILEPLNGHGAIHSTDPSSQINGISMFHHIHCLIVIRAFVFPETSLNMTKNNTQHPQPGNPGRDMHHVAHCFDYIAQGIICAADDLIEPPKDGVGEGDPHYCRDAKSLWEWSEQSWFDHVDMSDLKPGTGARSYMPGKNLKKPDRRAPEVFGPGYGSWS